ncbi:ankyrin repeat domain-containing protein [Chloropicon primus]|uniref:Ankyrin repeat domain-containing protein n=1 Tax=Chloropicon primus TaxID=1764295 RepID=A0A5B8MVI5_9CHLO|nr:ankyrin repeat domain-containing protein [Chloropicon primus]UPR04017.1 ankyrin repeat domain-containing protein [Chloropicon primus]|eukprot:QDZ24808.1 ankyrin repeat domain-containing protein [Chloropicon primus]
MFDMPDHLEKMVKVGVSYALEAAHESVDRCSYDCLRVLLKFGNIELDSGLDGDDEWTLVLRAVINDHPNCLRILLEHGADPNVQIDGLSPIHEAAERGHVECLRLLVAYGAEKDSLLESGDMTPLQFCVRGGHIECLRFLLDVGASPDIANVDGTTPIIYAAAENQVECLRMLLESGADKDRANGAGLTPVQHARDHGHARCLKLLLEAGATLPGALTGALTAPEPPRLQRGLEGGLPPPWLLGLGVDKDGPLFDFDSGDWKCATYHAANLKIEK